MRITGEQSQSENALCDSTQMTFWKVNSLGTVKRSVLPRVWASDGITCRKQRICRAVNLANTIVRDTPQYTLVQTQRRYYTDSPNVNDGL